MKKVILISAMILGFISNAQIHNASGNIKTKSSFAFTNEDYLGYWYSENATHLVIWKDAKNAMQVVEFSSYSNTPLDIISTDFNKTNLLVKTNFKETDWTIESEFTFVDSTTLKCTITGNANSTEIYKKIK
jgi:hypothetical protein